MTTPPSQPWYWRFWAGLFSLAAVSALAATTPSNWSVRVWQSDDGVPNNNVTSLAETPDGYLWLATPTRVARFDGGTFESVSREVFAPGRLERTSTLLQSRDGGLWLAMDHGPVIYAKAGRARMFTNDFPDQAVLTLTEDGDGALWITYRGGEVRRLKGDRVTRFGTEDGLPEWSIPTLATDNHGTLWFAKGGAAGVFRDGRFQVLVRVTRPNITTRVIGAKAGGIWICAGTEVFRYEEGKPLQSIGTFQPEQPADQPNVLLEDRAGRLWIGMSSSGLFHYDGKTFEAVPAAHREVFSLLEDREGNIWVGTAGGLNRVQPRAMELETAATGLPFEALQSICADTSDVIWAVTQNGLLLSRSNGLWSTVSTNADWPGGMASCVASDRDGAVWIATQARALYRWHDGKYTSWRLTNGLVAHVIHTLLVDRAGDLWIGGNAPESLQRLHGDQLEQFKLPADVRVIRAMTEDVVGNIWFGTSKGILMRAANGRVVDETAVMGGPRSIRSLLATPDGALWIGYAGWGLGRLKDGHFTRFSTETGLFDEYIDQIAADDHGWLWFGSDHGIFKVRQSELTEIAQGKATRLRSILYGRSAGMPSLQATFGAAPNVLQTRDCRLWMPMGTALTVIDPRKIRDDLAPSPVLLKRVVVDEQTVASYGGVMPVPVGLNLQTEHAALELPPAHRRLDFEFAALSFGAPENVRFQYRLDGFDENWIEAGMQRVASYSRLSAGTYHFRVRGCNSSGTWNDAAQPLAFTVTPFIWQNWWFQLGVLGVFTLSVIALVRYLSFRRLQLKVRALEQQAALDKERARIARDIHDDVGNRLTRITLLSGLALRDRTEPDKTSGHVQQISSAVRQVTDSLDEIVWAVNPRNDTLAHLINYIGQYAVEFLNAAGVKACVDLPDHPPERSVSADVRHNLFLVTKEALNNIVRHANAREVSLRVTVNGEWIGMSIEDDGRGFDRAPDNGSADGLRNMRQRMEEIGGEFGIESGPERGTCISLKYAWRK